MKIQFIEKIKEFFEKRKLKKLPDKLLEEKVEQNIEGEKIEKVPFMFEAINNKDTKIELAKKVMESPEIPVETKTEILDNLTHKDRVKLFKENVKSKKLLAQENADEFVKIITTDKNLQPYDELYYRVDEAFSDLQLANILEIVKRERPESYDEEKVLRIVAKQIDVNLKKYGSFLSSHAGELFGKIILQDKKEETGERKFDILNPDDRQRLNEAMKEERDEIVENTKGSITKQESNRLTDDIIDAQIQQVVDFQIKRQQELSEQNSGKEI